MKNVTFRNGVSIGEGKVPYIIAELNSSHNGSVETAKQMIEAAKECGCDRVELYTAAYAEMYPSDPAKAIEPYLRTAEAVRKLGLGLNAGHDLNLENLEYFIRNIPWTDEVSIGHAVICDALYMGLEKTIQAYLSKIKIF